LNSVKRRKASVAGNVMIYILLAAALLGALTILITREGDVGGDSLESEKAELLATQVISYSSLARQAIDHMILAGSNPGDLVFAKPADGAAYTAGSHIHKVFHPAGGGLDYKLADAAIFDTSITSPAAGWYMIRASNVEWTPTSAHDVLLSAVGIKKDVCAAINKKLLGASAIPEVNADFTNLFTTGPAPFTELLCPACSGNIAACVKRTGAELYSFYTIAAGQ